MAAAFALVLAAPAGGAPPTDASRRTPVVAAVERVSPAVVNISAERVQEQRMAPFGGLMRDPFFERFFEDFGLPEYRHQGKSTSLGSGFIVDGEGRVLTNAHVVAHASDIRVTLVDERSFPAELVASDPSSDLAVLKIKDGKGLPQVSMGVSDDLMVGETVIAIGNPFGLSHTVTSGVISATRRSFKGNGQEFRDFIQTDASINPGNSGGPLVNIHGEVIGVNTAIVQAAEGIGFAIPVGRARRILSDLLTYGQVQLVWTGVDVQTVTPDLAPALGMTGRPGVVVTRIEPDGPGEKAGLRNGDVITSFASRPVVDEESFFAAVDSAPRGAPQALEGLRDKQPLALKVTPASPPSDYADRILERSVGLRVKADERGVVVKGVRKGSAAEQSGIRAGDRLVGVGESMVESLEAFRQALLDARGRGRVRLTLRRGNVTASFVFPLG